MARPVKEINAGSMADIAFLLLIFFLMVTTMDIESGLQRRLPPMPDENQKQDDIQVNRRNILVVRLNDSDGLLAGGEMMNVTMLKDKAKEFLLNPANDVSLPEKEEKIIEGFGPFQVSKGVISLQNTRGTSYKAYIEVQNELVKAVNEIRDDFAMVNFGKKYIALDEDRQRIVRDAIPQNISEAEPKDTGRKR
ncbi:MAG: biopolymer transporter ExbD [Bacteroidetes bacterium GWE2_39_28]|jgi:biopolymer transport protein ExbD|nr:biopolymer transporter ExbD [Bacteroidales bacterium]OFX78075.1 MAG: biopolymer transporter ExbD [Bacteroidetes bacterium GWE2_39_28]OFY11666.1 MAG: biopolymer transporter ExbD [Bacteroidetes bacterium GWF2_39_10]OFZ06671.1 MAG: biopolymer transporter ExbD [Bacteroidetes bacterium RIFOXYB2_FULL_39_7]OFZ11552.1 MAG: biopolymer transporter ExbD [Bacteroidetes bacterium RIFOXYC2_FULL_39_11]HCT94735.1 biopolymer transporter ExbD [Rikenellaceae bacterium]